MAHSDEQDRLLDRLLQEVLGGDSPPDLSDRILSRAFPQAQSPARLAAAPVPPPRPRLAPAGAPDSPRLTLYARRSTRYALAAGLVLAVGLVAWIALHQGSTPLSPPPPPVAAYPAPVATGGYMTAQGRPAGRGEQIWTIGQTAALDLGGYCRVELGPKTRLKIEGAEHAEAITLEEGQVACQVEKGQGRFDIHTDLGMVSVIGTQFSVALEEHVDDAPAPPATPGIPGAPGAPGPGALGAPAAPGISANPWKPLVPVNPAPRGNPARPRDPVAPQTLEPPGAPEAAPTPAPGVTRRLVVMVAEGTVRVSPATGEPILVHAGDGPCIVADPRKPADRQATQPLATQPPWAPEGTGEPEQYRLLGAPAMPDDQRLTALVAAIAQLNLTPDFDLSPAQKTGIQQVRDDWKTDLARFIEDTRPERQQLQDKIAKSAGRADPQAYGALLREMWALTAKGPNQDLYRARIKAQLTPPQRQAVEEKIKPQDAERRPQQRLAP